MRGIIDDLLPVVDDILGVRDDIGAVIYPVFIVRRTWSGAFPGDGTFVDEKKQVLPSPQLVNLKNEYQALQGGNYQQGDIILRNISKNQYKTQDEVDGTSGAKNVEVLYLMDSKLHTVTSVKSNYLTWDVQIRKIAHNQGYGA